MKTRMTKDEAIYVTHMELSRLYREIAVLQDFLGQMSATDTAPPCAPGCSVSVRNGPPGQTFRVESLRSDGSRWAAYLEGYGEVGGYEIVPE